MSNRWLTHLRKPKTVQIPVPVWRKKFDEIFECVGEHIADTAEVTGGGKIMEVTIRETAMLAQLENIVFG